MRVHHLNCGTFCPPFGRLIDGRKSLLSRGHLVCHCLLIEAGNSLVLVDTGLGSDDLARPRERLGASFARLMRPALDVKETAIHQVRALGFDPADVRHILLTHLDLDHAGGLADFPAASVHVYRPEHEAATARGTLLEQQRYRPQQWAHGARFHLYDSGGEPWFGFDCVRQLDGLPPEILIVPVTGHTRGHAAIAISTPAPPPSDPGAAPWSRRGAGWLLHAGDAYFYRGEMDPNRRACPAGLDLYQRTIAVDNAARATNQERLRALARERAGNVRVFSAHDQVELERCRAERWPA